MCRTVLVRSVCTCISVTLPLRARTILRCSPLIVINRNVEEAVCANGSRSLVTKKRTAWAASTLWLGFLLLAIALADTRAVATPPPSLHVRAIPAFARKYGMPCSACHEAWPKLNNFGQTFKDNGYQMMNDRDAPIFQQAADHARF